MTFEQLRIATSIVNNQTRYFEWVDEWKVKREVLAVLLMDLPKLVAEYKARQKEPYENDSRITLTDEIPRIRLISACEATANCLYGLAEISAQFGNKASRGVLPSSFNAIRKRVQAGTLDQTLSAKLGDLQWYLKVRELRTEWVHFSTIFVAEKDDEPLLIARTNRRKSDREQFADPKGAQFAVGDLIDWTRKAILTIDAFGDFLLEEYVLPNFDPDVRFQNPVYDKEGFPKLTADNRFVVEEVSIREFFSQYGMKAGP
jgi:hypothetical protein